MSNFILPDGSVEDETFKVKLAESVTPPLVPIISIEYVFSDVVEEVEIVTAEEQELVRGSGVQLVFCNVHDMSDDIDGQFKLTVCVAPGVNCTVTNVLVELPGVTVPYD